MLSGFGGNDFDYGGRFDVLLNFDTQKLGLWAGGMLRTHTEYRYGDLNSNLGGTLLATNSALLLPTGKHERVVVTSIHLAQRIGNRINVLLGRINALDLLAADQFFGGGGRSRFLNVAFSAPPSGITPAVIVGAVVTLRTAPIAWTFMVFDPDDRTDDYWSDDFFGNGVDVSVSASYAGEMLGHTSSLTVTGTYTSKDGANLGELLLPPDLQTGRKDHSWYISVQFGSYLHESPGRQGTGWGVFLKTAASDGNPNPFEASIMGGVGGKGLFASRPNDTLGIGYFYVDFSNDLQSSLNPLLTFHDEQGVEAFYNYVVTDWLQVAVDLQYVDPALGDTDNAFVAGLRATIRF